MKIRSNTKSEIITLAGSNYRMQEAIVQGKEFRKEVTCIFRSIPVHIPVAYKA